MTHLRHRFCLTATALLLSCGVPFAGDKTNETSNRSAVDGGQIEVSPKEVTLTGKDSRYQILVTAISQNGRREDVTRQVRFRSADPNVAQVTVLGIIQPTGSGKTSVEIVRGSSKVSIPVTVREGDRYLPVSFTNDVVPILTKMGCNSGGCHGKSGGRGGFQLSLFGFNPKSDFDAIVHESRGRRLLTSAPDYSLFLLKPAGRVGHGGGKRLPLATVEYERLRRWIATGAQWGADAPALERIAITPLSHTLSYDSQQQIVVTAHYSDGSYRDVTPLTEFHSNNTAIAVVNGQGLVTSLSRVGETAIVCKYDGKVGVTNILVPLEKSLAKWPKLPRGNFIDDHVMAKLRKLNVPPSALVNDAGFLRRATLQIAGRLPTVAETKTFADSKKPDKRAQLINRLLASGDHADFFALKWSHVLRNKLRNQRTRTAGTVAFHRWIRNAIAKNMPYDRFVESILTATGNPEVNPPAQWYAEVRYLDRYVDDTAQVFLGTRIGCARCHNHPFEKYTQDDYYGLASFFGRVARKGGTGIQERRANETIYVKAAGSVSHPVTKKVVLPHGLEGPLLNVPAYDDPRAHLVDWMRRPDNRYFARAFVNRTWAHFFGRGLVEPLDDIRDTNPAINEPLLDTLADEFIKSRFNMKHVVRLIVTSTTYQLSSTPNEDNLEETQAFSRFYPQRLKAEVLYDSIDVVTRTKPARFPNMPEGTKAVQLPHEGFNDRLLELFGRPTRESACECERVTDPSLGQALFLMNNTTFLRKVESSSGLAGQLAKDKRPTADKVRDLFLAALSREPNRAEMDYALEHLRAEKNSVAAYSDLIWVLLNTKEFLYVL